jgi:hypothetical protein
MIPHAEVYESKSSDSIFTTEVGVHISIVPIAELGSEQYIRYIRIDNQEPTLPLIEKYRKKIASEGDLSYGDYRQFEPEQTVYKNVLPKDVEVHYDSLVCKVDLVKKEVYISDKDAIGYDFLISTIPLLNLVKLTNLFSQFKENVNTFFMHRPIYVLREEHDTAIRTIQENYITDPDNPIYRENYIDGLHNRESLFKIEGAVKIYPGKIYPSSHANHIMEDLISYGVFCAGRYAQWDNRIHMWNVYSQLKFIREAVK